MMNSSTSIEPPGGKLDYKCRARQNLRLRRCNWLSITILIFAVYSTAFSGIWLGVAMRKPRYGRWIANTGKLTPATASVLCAALAKTVELSFVAVYVTLLGQALSRRALAKRSEGVTIANMTMHAWVMQPGTMITHWHTIRFAGPTILGVITLFAALTAMMYTTASDGLEPRLLHGKVTASFGNTNYIRSQCQTPINKDIDSKEYKNTCVLIEHPGQAYHNFMQYLAKGTTNLDQRNGSDVLMDRPRPSRMMCDNTTVIGSWIHAKNMKEVFAQFGSRIINNISMATPHSGVFAAAREPKNNIVQPQDLNGLGEYHIWASIPSLSANILCASMTEDELASMVYEMWPSAQEKGLNVSKWRRNHNIPTPPEWLNKTSVDDVFSFGEKYGRRHPVFPKLPRPYNAILNFSSVRSDSLYLLATSELNVHMICSIRASLTSNCSTEYHVGMSGGSLTNRCDDPADGLSYHKTDPTAPHGLLEWDWIEVAFIWATSVSLGGGITDNDAAISRLLTQFIPTKSRLDPALPSIAEALAVLAGCTLFFSSNGAPFVHFYNYSVPELFTPQYQSFNAILRAQDYASGGARKWQGIFYTVFAIVFATNVFCLIWLIIRGGFITGFIEPSNLFSILLNSPQSQGLEGSCGGGPENEQFAIRWFIKHDQKRGHFTYKKGNRSLLGGRRRSSNVTTS